MGNYSIPLPVIDRFFKVILYMSVEYAAVSSEGSIKIFAHFSALQLD